VWESFHEVLEPTLLPAVKCKGCRHSFKHPSFYKKNAFSTSSLTRHENDCLSLKRLKRRTQSSNDTSQVSNDISALFQKQSEINDNNSDILTEDLVKDAVLDFFISGSIPFNQADSPEFQRLITMIKVKTKSVKINRKNLRSRLTDKADQGEQDLIAELAANKSRVSLALDGWTSRINNAYLGMFLVAYK